MVNALIAIHVIGKEKKLDFLNQALEKFLLIVGNVFPATVITVINGG
tara:strand:- start:54 stop:194 length:141 start_codon:yes stop_codon:yes gene_type:complete